MIKKTALFLLSVLLLTGCSLLQKKDPQPTQTQTTLVSDLTKVIDDLDNLQKTQDEPADAVLITD